MRLIVINTARDPSYVSLRREHAREIHLRPEIAGLALAAPSGRRVLPTDLLSAEVLNRLEYLASIGNIRVVESGARGPVNWTSLRIRLGYVRKEPVENAPVVREEEVDAANEGVEEPPDAVQEAPSVPSEPSLETDAGLEKLLEEAAGDAASTDGQAVPPEVASNGAAQVPTPETWVAPVTLLESLQAARNATLSAALTVLGVQHKAGMNKAKLIQAAASAFGDEGADSAAKFRALSLVLSDAEQ